MPRGAIFARMPDRYAISLTGILGDRPPTDHKGFLDYVKSLPVPEIYQAARQAEPLGPPASSGPREHPAALRAAAQASRRPAGDGGRGVRLQPRVRAGDDRRGDRDAVLARHLTDGPHAAGPVFRDLARVIDAPWDMSAGADLGFPGTKGRRTLKVRMGNAYIPRLQAAAVTDSSLSAAFLRAAGLVDPPQALLRPKVVARVLFPRSGGPAAGRARAEGITPRTSRTPSTPPSGNRAETVSRGHRDEK